VHLERSLSAEAVGGAGGENFSLGLTSPLEWCREQSNAPSIVLSSSWWYSDTRLSWHQRTTTLRGLSMPAAAVTMGKRGQVRF